MLIKGEYGTAVIHAAIVDDTTKEQVKELMNQKFVKDLNVRIMPDCHAGKGCVIGTTMNVVNSCVPNLVGVDIGCGMFTVELGKMNINLEQLDNYIKENILSGENIYEENQEYNTNIRFMECYDKLKHKKRFDRSIGTLGGGNHFIEIDKDEDDNLYLIIHSGSRNLGVQVCEHYMDIAENNLKHKRHNEIHELATQMKKEGKVQLIQKEIDKIMHKYSLINKSLLPLYGTEFKNYLHDMNICQEYAKENRERIATKILNYLGLKLTDFEHFHTIHNYINMTDKMLRKGAISAYKGEKVLIPINMRDGAIIGMGKSNKDYNYSAPHGAGRIISRQQAKKRITMEDYRKSMEGIYSSCVCKSTIDESPFVYKSINAILPNILETIDIVKIIKPIYNFKAK